MIVCCTVSSVSLSRVFPPLLLLCLCAVRCASRWCIIINRRSSTCAEVKTVAWNWTWNTWNKKQNTNSKTGVSPECTCTCAPRLVCVRVVHLRSSSACFGCVFRLRVSASRSSRVLVLVLRRVALDYFAWRARATTCCSSLVLHDHRQYELLCTTDTPTMSCPASPRRQEWQSAGSDGRRMLLKSRFRRIEGCGMRRGLLCTSNWPPLG